MINVKNDRLPLNTLVTVVVLDGRDETQVLSLAASLACAAEHPLGAAILGSGDYDIKLCPVERLQRLCGAGVTGLIDGHDVFIGNPAFVATLGLSPQYLGNWAVLLAEQGQEVTFVGVDSALAGLIGTTTDADELSRKRSLHGGHR